MQNSLMLIIALAVFMLLIYFVVGDCKKPIEEGWADYQELPFGNIKSGSGGDGERPMGFYERPIYRRPLNWPICHLVDYPVPHCRSDSL